ncbi:prenyltransferase [Dietzia sp.]|uniref:prenyltransferase n=1 Tax=Dietzia sp. TaxID=1871616 RepID=UPI002FDAA966
MVDSRNVERAARAVPEVPGVLSREQAAATGAWIASVQRENGQIPWFTGGHTDPWDHVESAMGLSVAGFWEEAERSYHFLRDTQRPDGSWPMRWQDDVVEDAGIDANYTAYVAVGVWHHFRVTADENFLRDMWDCVRRALALVLEFRGPEGQIWYSRSAEGELRDEALLTGSASMHHALRCGVLIATELGETEPVAEWDAAADRIGGLIRTRPEIFSPKDRYSMDWYYPVLGGVVVGEEAASRIETRWDDFVVEGLGIRCVDDHPWVTGAETCELVLSLEAVDRHAAALEQFRNMQHLRDPDGSYWTGLVFSDGKRWPVELSTWTAAAVLLAADALSRTTPGNDVFRYVSNSTAARLAGR